MLAATHCSGRRVKKNSIEVWGVSSTIAAQPKTTTHATWKQCLHYPLTLNLKHDIGVIPRQCVCLISDNGRDYILGVSNVFKVSPNSCLFVDDILRSTQALLTFNLFSGKCDTLSSTLQSLSWARPLSVSLSASCSASRGADCVSPIVSGCCSCYPEDGESRCSKRRAGDIQSPHTSLRVHELMCCCGSRCWTLLEETPPYSHMKVRPSRTGPRLPLTASKINI